MKINIKDSFKTIKNFIGHNSSTILTGMAVVGTVSAVVMAIKATPLAIDAIKQDESERAEKLINPEEVTSGFADYIRVCWKIYTPTALMTLLSVSCAVSAQTINLKRNAALMALYSASATSLKEYKSKAAELFGERKANEISDNIDKDHIEANPTDPEFITKTGIGDTLCFDTWSGRYFEHDIETIRKIINDLNKSILNVNYVTLNEYYMSLGLDNVKEGDDIGWNSNNMLEVRFSSQLTANNRPCLVVDFQNMPNADF